MFKLLVLNEHEAGYELRDELFGSAAGQPLVPAERTKRQQFRAGKESKLARHVMQQARACDSERQRLRRSLGPLVSDLYQQRDSHFLFRGKFGGMEREEREASARRSPKRKQEKPKRRRRPKNATAA